MSLFAQHAAKSDDRTQAHQVHVERGCHTLEIQAVGKVADIEWQLSLHILENSSEGSEIKQNNYRYLEQKAAAEQKVSEQIHLHTFLSLEVWDRRAHERLPSPPR